MNLVMGVGVKNCPSLCFTPLIQKPLEHIAEKLILPAPRRTVGLQPHVLKQPHYFQQHVGILIKQFFVVDVDKCKVVVGKELELPEKLLNGIAGGVGVVFHVPKRPVNLAVVDVRHLFAQKPSHAFLIQFLKPVLQLEIRIVGNALPVKFEVGGVIGFVNKFCRETD